MLAGTAFGACHGGPPVEIFAVVEQFLTIGPRFGWRRTKNVIHCFQQSLNAEILKT